MVNAYATALGGGDGQRLAHATAVEQYRRWGAGASANVYNSNTIAVAANADVTVGNAAHRGSYALASAGANGIAQHVNGGTGSTSTAGAPVFTDDFGLNAYSSQRTDRRRVHPHGKRTHRPDRACDCHPDQHGVH